MAGRVPANAILKVLFDLAALASGQNLKAASPLISMPTARSQLAQISHKTGTHQQSQLSFPALIRSNDLVNGF